MDPVQHVKPGGSSNPGRKLTLRGGGLPAAGGCVRRRVHPGSATRWRHLMPYTVKLEHVG